MMMVDEISTSTLRLGMTNVPEVFRTEDHAQLKSVGVSWLKEGDFNTTIYSSPTK